MTNELLYGNDQELLTCLSQGEAYALSVIYQKYWERLFLSAYQVLRDRQACEDIIQDIFVQLWQRRTSLCITTSLQSYLLSATRYQVFRYIRRHVHKQDLFEHLDTHFSDDVPGVALQLKDIQKRVNDVVEHLPTKCKDIYKLSREQHFSYKEIAEQLSISPKTVENQLSIALKRLRHALGDLMLVLVSLAPLFV